jgi:hypothetical protein
MTLHQTSSAITPIIYFLHLCIATTCQRPLGCFEKRHRQDKVHLYSRTSRWSRNAYTRKTYIHTRQTQRKHPWPDEKSCRETPLRGEKTLHAKVKTTARACEHERVSMRPQTEDKSKIVLKKRKQTPENPITHVYNTRKDDHPKSPECQAHADKTTPGYPPALRAQYVWESEPRKNTRTTQSN